MEFKKLANNTINFGINRIIETAGIALVVIGFLLLVSLTTFSPDDPNFIFPDNTEIKNLLGFNGSYTADLFFRTFGLIALLIPFTLIFSGLNIVISKKIFLIFESIFYSVLYSSFGSLFFSFFYPSAFNLYINGNGGFIGKYLETTFLTSMSPGKIKFGSSGEKVVNETNNIKPIIKIDKPAISITLLTAKFITLLAIFFNFIN